jgi:hypothetical protein
MNVIYMNPELENSILGDVDGYSQEGIDLMDEYLESINGYFFSLTSDDPEHTIERGKTVAAEYGFETLVVEHLS